MVAGLPLSTGSMPTRSSMAFDASRRSAFVPICQIVSGSDTMSITRRRGFSDEIGSWKIIWTWVRSVRRSPRLSAVMSVSLKRMRPDVARSTCTTARPVVVFPQPDSPTRPSVSPCRMVKEIPATACTAVLPFWNVTCRSSTDNSGSDTCSADAAGFTAASVTPWPLRAAPAAQVAVPS